MDNAAQEDKRAATSFFCEDARSLTQENFRASSHRHPDALSSSRRGC
jgi:hypothetical protein